jgi:hypothetical protein
MIIWMGVLSFQYISYELQSVTSKVCCASQAPIAVPAPAVDAVVVGVAQPADLVLQQENATLRNRARDLESQVWHHKRLHDRWRHAAARSMAKATKLAETLKESSQSTANSVNCLECLIVCFVSWILDVRVY